MPLSLQREHAARFTALHKAEGAALIRAGRVGKIMGSAFGRVVDVQGKDDEYTVFLMASGIFCNCVQHERMGACPHAWAAICKVDDEVGGSHGRAWDLALQRLERREARPSAPSGSEYRVAYALSWDELKEGSVGLQVLAQQRRKNGNWGARKLLDDDTGPLPAEDEAIMPWLRGARRRFQSYYEGWRRFADGGAAEMDLLLPSTSLAALLPQLLATGRVYVGTKKELSEEPILMDEGEPWKASALLEGEGRRRVSLGFRRDDEHIPAESVQFTVEGWILSEGTFRRVTPAESVDWVAWSREGPVEVDEEDLGAFLSSAQSTSLGRALQLPEGWEEVDAPADALRPVLTLKKAARRAVQASLAFDYDGLRVSPNDPGSLADPEQQIIVRRDTVREEDHRVRFLRALGPEAERASARDRNFAAMPILEIDPGRVPALVEELRADGWLAEAEGTQLRSMTGSSASVRSGVDWFDLEGGLEFEGESVAYPEVLEALKNGDRLIALGDGSQGLLPEDWLKRAGLLGLARVQGDALRFRRSQGLLMDMLLSTAPKADLDAPFKKLRKALAEFKAPAPVAEPRGFRGELRPYQREALGWMKFLDKFGFGGCLADDMGLGKTVQVLAYLQSRRLGRGPKGPNLVIAPRSVVSNWISEAVRFTPGLSVLDFSTTDRSSKRDLIGEHELIVTTYAILRRDVEFLSSVAFGCVILDEAQAIKNGNSQTAKASRLLQSRQRLALSGTPIENRIDELWSLFEFLNPGMFGSTTSLKALMVPTSEAPQPLARALRPFVLRRKKSQVAKSLPERSEQVLVCEMKGEQKKQYRELLNHYRASIDKKIEKEGLGRAKMHVLEALTRLRQAACHPALLNEDTRAASAKTDLLLDRLREVIDEGHKALVFSQFTSFLALVKQELDAAGITYEYLDGRSRKREQLVERFQEDENCPVFLISLKAGGTGLNLTAADYVFLLDPWWNPAVEAQAIDRAHRIGQTRNVFAYRLIAKDTIEEKILALQDQKRELAESILSGGSTTLRDLTREDLELLLS